MRNVFLEVSTPLFKSFGQYEDSADQIAIRDYQISELKKANNNLKGQVTRLKKCGLRDEEKHQRLAAAKVSSAIDEMAGTDLRTAMTKMKAKHQLTAKKLMASKANKAMKAMKASRS